MQEIQGIYLILVALLFYFFFIIVLDDEQRRHKQKLLARNKNKFFIFSNIDEKDFNKSMKAMGWNISLYKYQRLRLIILCTLIIVLKIDLLLLLILFLISEPKEYILGRKTIFKIMIDSNRERYKKEQDKEIYNALVQLKNLAIATKNKPLATDFILRQLSKFSNKTKTVFNHTLIYWRENSEEVACDYFSKAIGTKLASEFANYLGKLDKVNPDELIEQLQVLQEGYREKHITNEMKKQELISSISFIPIIIASLVIMLNFIIIVIWNKMFI